MACFLAPESPQPSSVITESFFQQWNGLPIFNSDNKRCLFGEKYEKELCFYLAKHIEVNCTDKYCLIGEDSQWASIIQERLFLNNTVYFIDCNLSHDEVKKQLSINKFDRIIVLNCLHKLDTSFIKLFYKHGRLLIVHRQPSSTTLPLPIEILTNWVRKDRRNKDFLEQIYRDKRGNIEISEQDETVKFITHKLYWYSLIANQLFYPLNLINQQQITDGLRRMNETYFKYHHGFVEIFDRLLFLTVQKKTDFYIPRSLRSRNYLPIKLSITNETNELLNLREQYKKQDLYKSSIQFIC